MPESGKSGSVGATGGQLPMATRPESYGHTRPIETAANLKLANPECAICQSYT